MSAARMRAAADIRSRPVSLVLVTILVGVIGGQILGLWRVGSRYNETVIKVGAIFTIIPLLNIVAPILVLIGAYQVKGRLPAAR